MWPNEYIVNTTFKLIIQVIYYNFYLLRPLQRLALWPSKKTNNAFLLCFFISAPKANESQYIEVKPKDVIPRNKRRKAEK